MIFKRSILVYLFMFFFFQNSLADKGWNFLNIKSKSEAHERLYKQGGVGFDYDWKESANGKKLKNLFTDWCNTYKHIKCDEQAFKNFKVNMKRVNDINNDTKLNWWASGNAFSHLDETTFLKRYTGFKESETVKVPARTVKLQAIQNSCRFYSSRGSIPAPVVTECTKCRDACYHSGRCIFYSWNNGPRSNLYSSGACNNKSPPPASSPPPTQLTYLFNDTINWVSLGKVTPVRPNQGICGSCWAYTAIGTIESNLLVNNNTYNNETLDLSEQELVSCAESNGCNGGSTWAALNYACSHGVLNEAILPYIGKNSLCPSNLTPRLSLLPSLIPMKIQRNSETALIRALQKGPVAVTFGGDASFSMYAGGIYSSNSCPTTPNHAMLAVGWGYDNDLKRQYILVKNSFGSEWGEGGFARIAMIGDGPGMCGMYDEIMALILNK